jgi:hypothetical protein
MHERWWRAYAVQGNTNPILARQRHPSETCALPCQSENTWRPRTRAHTHTHTHTHIHIHIHMWVRT